MNRDYAFELDPKTLEATVTFPTVEKIARDVAAAIGADHDRKVTSALLALGWTPPLNSDTADALLWEMADDAVPADVRESAARWKLDNMMVEMWRAAWVAGWRAARKTA